MDQFMGFVPTKNSVTTNYTGDRGTGILIQDESDRQGSFLEVAVSTILIVKNVKTSLEDRNEYKSIITLRHDPALRKVFKKQ